jgi:hypothetical protein
MSAFSKEAHMIYKNFALADLRALSAPLSSARIRTVLLALDTRDTLDATELADWKGRVRLWPDLRASKREGGAALRA